MRPGKGKKGQNQWGQKLTRERLTFHTGSAYWEEPEGKGESVVMKKSNSSWRVLADVLRWVCWTTWLFAQPHPPLPPTAQTRDSAHSAGVHRGMWVSSIPSFFFPPQPLQALLSQGPPWSFREDLCGLDSSPHSPPMDRAGHWGPTRLQWPSGIT